MAENIKHVAIHDLVRNDEGFAVSLGKADFKVTPTARRVVDSLHDLYKQRVSKSHGQFAADDDHYPTQAYLKAFKGSGYKDFGKLTIKLMEALKLRASRRGAATGGHVFFAHFERDKREYLLVTILNDKLGAAVTEELDVEDINHLDIDGFKFAGRINITGWLNQEKRYISFLKGKGNVADYFKEFLGCDTAVQEKEDTLLLVKTMRAYADTLGYDVAEKGEFLKKVRGICHRHAHTGKELDLTSFANELFPEDPTDLIGELAKAELNNGFIPNKSALGGLVKFQGKTPYWSLEFERDAISSGDIKFDSATGILTIKNLPEKLRRELNHEYGND
ncbi:nucleoid-associated protein [Sinorhizobium phage phi2LM21]|nr:nucleoid-associated protein [Sinorhizobium phage phi2LM21]